tara:strand:+ start:126 stop:257 length:132 start_codon:yes stop_codon:yes gene_type:complete
MKIQDVYYNQGKIYWPKERPYVPETPNLGREGRIPSENMEVIK